VDVWHRTVSQFEIHCIMLVDLVEKCAANVDYGVSRQIMLRICDSAMQAT